MEPDDFQTTATLSMMIVGLIAAAIGTIFYTNHWLTERFSENTRVRAELRSALYTGNLLSELQRTSVVPLLLARDPALIGALSTKDYATVSARLIAAQKDIGAASIRLLDASGRTVGSTDRNLIGTNYVQEPFYVESLRSKDTVFTVSPSPTVCSSTRYSSFSESKISPMRSRVTSSMGVSGYRVGSSDT